MTEKRLADIALLSIENDLSDKISLDDLVTDFGGQDKNRTNNTFLIITLRCRITYQSIKN